MNAIESRVLPCKGRTMAQSVHSAAKPPIPESFISLIFTVSIEMDLWKSLLFNELEYN